MSKAFVHTTCYLIIVLTLCIDKGNGSWKKKIRENLQKDIAKFEELAENIEDEIEDFYEEYSEKWPKDAYYEEDKTNYYDSRKTKELITNKKELSFVNVLTLNNTNTLTKNDKVSPMFDQTFSNHTIAKEDTIKRIAAIEKPNIVNTRWPKFEDILLDMGKKYDWKNDRWIKVKKKLNKTNEENHLNFHERHKFSYKTVKLNRGKSRRNVVIAVTAVR